MRFLCGTPKRFCKGSPVACNAGLGKRFEQKAHTSSSDAFKCYKTYKIKEEGFVEIGSRELRSPDGSGILVLSKQSKFGAALRKGKSESSIRFQPKGRAASGVIIKQ
jgi:hypothetical protein